MSVSMMTAQQDKQKESADDDTTHQVRAVCGLVPCNIASACPTDSFINSPPKTQQNDFRTELQKATADLEASHLENSKLVGELSGLKIRFQVGSIFLILL